MTLRHKLLAHVVWSGLLLWSSFGEVLPALGQAAEIIKGKRARSPIPPRYRYLDQVCCPIARARRSGNPLRISNRRERES